jgi:hypothetical protein
MHKLVRVTIMAASAILLSSACGNSNASGGRYEDGKELLEDYLTLRRDGRFTMKALSKEPYWRFEIDAQHAHLMQRVLRSVENAYLSQEALIEDTMLKPVVSFVVPDVPGISPGTKTTVIVEVVEPTFEDVLAATGLKDYWSDRIRTAREMCPKDEQRLKHEQRVLQGGQTLQAQWPKRYPTIWQAPVLTAHRNFELSRKLDGSVVITDEYGGAIPQSKTMPTEPGKILKGVDSSEFACYE